MTTFEERKAELADKLDDPANAVEEYDGFQFGDKVRVIEDDEEEGAWAGDEGTLIIERVGAVEYGSARVGLYVQFPGRTDPIEVQPDNIEQA